MDKTNMAEDKQDNSTTPTMDDLSVMRLLLHTIKGISAISTSTVPVYDDEDDSAL
jgi:hypothetical protein